MTRPLRRTGACRNPATLRKHLSEPEARQRTRGSDGRQGGFSFRDEQPAQNRAGGAAMSLFGANTERSGLGEQRRDGISELAYRHAHGSNQ